MPILDETGRGYPLPHPDNNPRTVDVPRLRQALELIDEDMTALAGSLDGKADASGVTAEISAAISALLAGAPEAYDTLVEIADKLASNDDVVAGILTSIAAKANIVDVFTRSEMEGALAAKAPLNSPVFVNKVTLPNGRVIDETNVPFEALVRVQRSANTQLVFGNVGSLIDCTGTFTQTFATPAALENGWWCYIRNSGTGDITIPASDGRTNWIMYPGEMRLFQCDKTVVRSIVIHPFTKTFTQSDSFIKPPGYTRFEGIVWNGGAAGAAGAASTESTYIAGGPGNLAKGGTGGSGGTPGTVRRIAALAEYLANSGAVVVGAGGSGTLSTTGAPGGASSVEGFGNIQNPAASAAADYLISAAGANGAHGGNGAINSSDGTAQTRTLGGAASPGTSTGFLPGSSGSGGKGGDGASSGSGTAGSDGGNATLRGAGGGGGGGGGGKFVSGDYTTGYNAPAGSAPGGKGGNGMRGEVLLWGVV